MIRPLLFFLLIASHCLANPFAINFPDKEEITNEDYIEIQKQLRQIDIVPFLQTLYTSSEGLRPFSEFLQRCCRGLRQVLIDPEKGYYPIVRLEKIGNGSDMCIVSTAPFDGVRSALLANLPEALRASGFNGYFYYRIGGYPNPTGKEIKYVGVPYSFKIFLMLEAENLGFNKVLWIDSACSPLCDPTPIFQIIDHSGIYYNEWNSFEGWRHLFPATLKQLQELTGADFRRQSKMWACLFGLKMDTPEAKKLIKEYYRLVELGTPFLSEFPEEFVLSAIFTKVNCSTWKVGPFPKYLKWTNFSEDTPEKIARAKREGYYFYQFSH